MKQIYFIPLVIIILIFTGCVQQPAGELSESTPAPIPAQAPTPIPEETPTPFTTPETQITPTPTPSPRITPTPTPTPTPALTPEPTLEPTQITLGSPIQIHQDTIEMALSRAETDSYYKYGIYASRILAVKHPEIYLQADGLFLEAIQTNIGFKKSYEITNVKDDYFVWQKAGGAMSGPPFLPSQDLQMVLP